MSDTPSSPTPLDRLHLSVWDDPLVDRLGHDPRSAYVEQYWLPTLGPSTVWLLRRCVAALERSPAGADLDLRETAAALGLGHKGGRNSPLARSIVRACRFGAARPVGDAELQVRRHLPPLNRGQVERLPAELQARHATYLEQRLQADDGELERRRARRVALGLMECGDSLDAAERQLDQWRFHPSVAAEAVRWVWNHRSRDATPGPEAA